MLIKRKKCPVCKREYFGNEASGQFTLHVNKEICNDCWLKENISNITERNELRIRNAIMDRNKSKTRLFRELGIHYYKVEYVIEKMMDANLLDVYTNKKGYKYYKVK